MKKPLPMLNIESEDGEKLQVRIVIEQGLNCLWNVTCKNRNGVAYAFQCPSLDKVLEYVTKHAEMEN